VSQGFLEATGAEWLLSKIPLPFTSKDKEMSSAFQSAMNTADKADNRTQSHCSPQ